MALDLSALTTSVTNAIGVEQSALTLLEGLSVAIATLQAEVAAQGADPATIAAIAALGAQLDTGTAALAAGVAANPVPA